MRGSDAQRAARVVPHQVQLLVPQGFGDGDGFGNARGNGMGAGLGFTYTDIDGDGEGSGSDYVRDHGYRFNLEHLFTVAVIKGT